MKQIRKYFEMTDFTGKLPTKSPKHTDAKTLHKIPANQIQQRQGPSKIYPRNAWLSASKIQSMQHTILVDRDRNRSEKKT